MAQTHPHSVRYSVEESTFCGGPLRVKKGAVLMRYSSPRTVSYTHLPASGTKNRVVVLTTLFFFLRFSLIILQIYLESVNHLRPPG